MGINGTLKGFIDSQRFAENDECQPLTTCSIHKLFTLLNHKLLFYHCPSPSACQTVKEVREVNRRISYIILDGYASTNTSTKKGRDHEMIYLFI
ncbi:unnamed protein product [Onchocerca flexuosa]|uniref:DDE_Tnp_1_7 domain-containing protein n=1 Tax=Onchocerca flexuosa TaxID=387005 RepID=A0A183HYQ7_9BILA|nr:unnamed protein product [Onchocerca flexuosa]